MAVCIGILKDGKSKCKFKANYGEYCGIHCKKGSVKNEIEPNPNIAKKENNLLVKKFPHLINEWDFDKNKDIDINKISFSSHKVVYWKCLNNALHESYKAPPNRKTVKKKNKIGTDCCKCFYDSLRIHDKKEVENRRQKHKEKNKEKLVMIGDESEKYITNLLKEVKKYKDVKTIGDIGGKADIEVINFDDSVNYIQVKTMSKTNKNKNDDILFYG